MMSGIEERCTTCYYFLIPFPERYCGHPDHHKPIRYPHKKCKDFIHMLDKGHVDRLEKKTYDDTRALIDCIYIKV